MSDDRPPRTGEIPITVEERTTLGQLVRGRAKRESGEWFLALSVIMLVIIIVVIGALAIPAIRENAEQAKAARIEAACRAPSGLELDVASADGLIAALGELQAFADLVGAGGDPQAAAEARGQLDAAKITLAALRGPLVAARDTRRAALGGCTVSKPALKPTETSLSTTTTTVGP